MRCGVLQEILHRYAAFERKEAIAPAFKVLLGVVDEVLAIERQDVPRAAANCPVAGKPAGF